MQRPARTSRAEQAERDFNAHMAQLVDKESPEWVLEAKHREALNPLPAGAAEDPMTQTKTDLVLQTRVGCDWPYPRRDVHSSARLESRKAAGCIRGYVGVTRRYSSD